MKLTPELFLALAGLCLHTASVAIWITLIGRLERWVWWTIFVGFLLLAAHRLDETVHWLQFPYSAHITAMAIAFVVLMAVTQTRAWVRQRELKARALENVQRMLAALKDQVADREPIAERVAFILGELKGQVEFYEIQARKSGLPLYKNQPEGG